MFVKIWEYSQENTCVEVGNFEGLQPYQKETPTKMFSCEYREISKNN